MLRSPESAVVWIAVSRHVRSESIPLRAITQPHANQRRRQHRVQCHDQPQQKPDPNAATTEASQEQRHERDASHHPFERRAPPASNAAPTQSVRAGYPAYDDPRGGRVVEAGNGSAQSPADDARRVHRQ
jgi:hypothetical protein